MSTKPHPVSARGDLTQGPILRTLLLFAAPQMVANLLQTLNGTVNAIWVGRLIGPSALAATANANIVMFLMFALIFGFSMATAVRVGQAFGAGDQPALRRTFGGGLGFCLTIALTVAGLGWVLAPNLLHLLATPAEARDEALIYLRVIFLSMPFSTFSLLVSGGLRGVGNATTPLRAMVLTVVVDIALNPLLIRGFGPIPALGIGGSAASTAFANLAGSLVMIWAIWRRESPLRLSGAQWRWLRPRQIELSYMLTKGLPMGAQMLLISVAGIVMIGLINREGLQTAAAYGASLQLWSYLQMPAFAISAAVSAMVAQNIGARQFRRVGTITGIGVLTCLAVTVAMAGLIVLFDRPLLVLFLGSGSPAVGIARHMQLICTWSFALTGVLMILNGTMRAFGAVLRPLLVMFIAMYPARIGFYFAAYPVLGPEALWWAFPVSSTLGVLLMWIAYRTSARPEVEAADLA